MKNVLKGIGITLMALGFLLMLGTAGACDVDAICFDMAVIRSVAAVFVACAGAILIYVIEKKEV